LHQLHAKPARQRRDVEMYEEQDYESSPSRGRHWFIPRRAVITMSHQLLIISPRGVGATRFTTPSHFPEL
jgi:hypothetical protein